MMKKCTKCRKNKELSEFSFRPNSRYKDGYISECKSCNAKRASIYEKTHTAERRKTTIKRKYNLLYEDWLKMWTDQEGKCKICQAPFIKPSDAHIDHSHRAGKVRSLLCFRCNAGLGCFDDDPNLMLKAMNYLTSSQGEANDEA